MLGSEVKKDNYNQNQNEDQKPSIHIKLQKTILNKFLPKNSNQILTLRDLICPHGYYNCINELAP